MKKLILTILIGVSALSLCGCMPFFSMPLNIPDELKQIRGAAYQEYDEDPYYEYDIGDPPEPTVYFEDDYIEPNNEPDEYPEEEFAGEYELGDIVFECGEELEYYEGDGGEAGYTLSLYHDIMLDIQMIPLDPDSTEAENIDLCEYAISAFLESAEDNVEFDGADIEIISLDGSDAYYTVFEAVSDGIPVIAANVVFATENYVYMAPVIAATEEYQNMYFDLVDSVEIINPAFYTFTPIDSGSSAGTRGDYAATAAWDYLKLMPFSHDGLIEQLKYDGFSQSEAEAAVDSLDVDWEDQAIAAAENHLKYSAYSYEGLYDQLVYEGFSSSQAREAIDSLDIDWTQQAVKCAADYIEYVDITDEAELEDQLIFEGFSKEEAQHGASRALADAGY